MDRTKESKPDLNQKCTTLAIYVKPDHYLVSNQTARLKAQLMGISTLYTRPTYCVTRKMCTSRMTVRYYNANGKEMYDFAL